MKNKKLMGTLLLLLTAFIWGNAFVAQSSGMDYVGPLTFMSSRFLLGGIVLIPVIIFIRRRPDSPVKTLDSFKKELKGALPCGIVCGILLGIASALQQYGLVFTTVSKAGFITTLYVIFVPIFSLFAKKHPGINIWIAVALATGGLYLLCVTEATALSLGDSLVFVCSIFYALQIMAVDKYVGETEPVLLSAIQFLTVGFFSLVPALIFEPVSLSALADAALPIAYAGIMSSGVAYTLQVFAQKFADPAVAAITMSFESVFAVLAAAVLLQERLSFKEGMGCVVMFLAIILAQLPDNFFTFKRSSYEN